MIEEEEYFREVEEHYSRKRGIPWPLSPKELKLIDEWFEAQIPMEVVLRGIDRAFKVKEGAEEKEISSLLYCRKIVKTEFKKHLKAMEGQKSAGETPAEAKNVGEYLNGLADSLGKSVGHARDGENSALADFLAGRHKKLMDAIVIPFQQNPETDLQRVEQQLSDLEKEIEQVLLTLVSEDRIQIFKEEAMRELKTFETRLDLAVYQEMLRRALIKSLRKFYNIPRLSLFYM